MRHLLLLTAAIVMVGSSHVFGETETEKLLAESDPTIQAKLSAVYNSRSEVDAFQQIQALKRMTNDKAEVVKQLAIYVVSAEKKVEFHTLQAMIVLHFLQFQLELQPSILIRLLAPYLDSENEDLQDFAELWFHSHDSNDRIHGKPPLGSVNYHEYMEYVRARLGRKEEIPAGFVEYIFEKHPGKALLVFAKAMGIEHTIAQLQAIHEARLGHRTPEEIREVLEKESDRKKRLDATNKERRELFLAEHIVSNAIWLRENAFHERLQKALPEAKEKLLELSKHDQWWARLYVAEIMRGIENSATRMCSTSSAMMIMSW